MENGRVAIFHYAPLVGILLQERIYFPRSKLFPFRAASIWFNPRVLAVLSAVGLIDIL